MYDYYTIDALNRKNMIKSLQDTYRLNNGVRIPCVGFGTFLTPDGKTAFNAVSDALKDGYRHIDTASYYGNEASVGRAVRESGIDRKKIFVTSKVWNDDQGYDHTMRAFELSMRNLGLDYLDLYLIHWPVPKGYDGDWKTLNRDTWRAMEELYHAGRIRSIGVSNFETEHLQALMERAEVTPAVDQIEIHPGLNRDDTVAFCKDHGLVVEAWSPFAHGKLFRSGLLDLLADKYGKTVAQICLRWHLQRGILPLPKSVTPQRIEENTQMFDFELAPEDMAFISGLPQSKPKRL